MKILEHAGRAESSESVYGAAFAYSATRYCKAVGIPNGALLIFAKRDRMTRRIRDEKVDFCVSGDVCPDFLQRLVFSAFTV